MTLPVILAFARGDEAERGFWRRTIEDSEQRAGRSRSRDQSGRRHGALADTLARARPTPPRRSRAGPFPDGPERRALTTLTTLPATAGFKCVAELSRRLQSHLTSGSPSHMRPGARLPSRASGYSRAGAGV